MEHIAPPTEEMQRKFKSSGTGASLDGVVQGSGPGGVNARYSKSNPPPPAFPVQGGARNNMLLFPPPAASRLGGEGDDMSEVSSLASVSYR